MKGLKDTLASLSTLRARFERLLAAKRAGSGPPPGERQLHEVAGFGSNPGNLRMLAHVPRKLSRNPGLVVALHGCTQTAAVYDHGSGWSTLADAHGFAVLFPEQQRANNPNNCFNWFLPADVRRDSGEALSIRQMVERMIVDHGIDRRRVFVVGLSAGGAMSAAMLATYPEVFAGGAVIAGLPYGGAANVHAAFESMSRGRDQSAQDWGGLVRAASPHRGPWPKISIWHGTSDTIVNAKNMEDALEQWIDVHGVTARPRIEHDVAGHSRRVWRTASGEDAIEAIAIGGMDHGVPLATGRGDGSCGNAGPFHFDVGLSSSRHIVGFWGLARKGATFEEQADNRARAHMAPAMVPSGTALVAAREDASADATFTRRPDAGDADTSGAATAALDPRAVITAALKAAGILGPAGNRNPLDPGGVIRTTLRSAGLLKK